MPELSAIAIVISGTALAVSLITMWVTLFRRGKLKMTQPTTVMFGPDGAHHEGDPKIYLRALLYSTAKRGYVIENMFVRLSRGEHRQSFPIWVLGDERLARGSGIFVGEQGVVANHHFLLPPDAEKYAFKAGGYRLEVFARVVGASQAELLWSNSLTISEGDAVKLTQPNNAIYFDWGPDSNRYIPSVKSKPPKLMPNALIEMFGKGLPASAPPGGSNEQ
jgi:hypothetical protein